MTLAAHISVAWSGPVVYTFEIVLVVASIQYSVFSNRDCDSNLDSCALFLFFSSVHPSILLWSVTVTVRCIVNNLLLSLAGRVFVHRVFISTILIFIYFTITVLSFNSCHHHDILWFVDLVGTQHIELIAHTGNETIAVLAIVCLQLRLEMIL